LLVIQSRERLVNRVDRKAGWKNVIAKVLDAAQ
jgi:hypothetical protein